MITARNQIENSLNSQKEDARSSGEVKKKPIKLNWNSKP